MKVLVRWINLFSHNIREYGMMSFGFMMSIRNGDQWRIERHFNYFLKKYIVAVESI